MEITFFLDQMIPNIALIDVIDPLKGPPLTRRQVGGFVFYFLAQTYLINPGPAQFGNKLVGCFLLLQSQPLLLRCCAHSLLPVAETATEITARNILMRWCWYSFFDTCDMNTNFQEAWPRHNDSQQVVLVEGEIRVRGWDTPNGLSHPWARGHVRWSVSGCSSFSSSFGCCSIIYKHVILYISINKLINLYVYIYTSYTNNLLKMCALVNLRSIFQKVVVLTSIS